MPQPIPIRPLAANLPPRDRREDRPRHPHRHRHRLPHDQSHDGPNDTSHDDPHAPPDRARARLLCDLVRLAVDGVAEVSCGRAARLVGPTPRGLQHRRQAAMYLAHVAFRVRTADVARGFGRDTTTVYHAYRQIEDMRDDEGLDAFLDAVESLVTGAAALADGAALWDGGA